MYDVCLTHSLVALQNVRANNLNTFPMEMHADANKSNQIILFLTTYENI